MFTRHRRSRSSSSSNHGSKPGRSTPSPPPPPTSNSSHQAHTHSNPEIPAAQSINSPDIRSSSMDSSASLLEYSDTSNEFKPHNRKHHQRHERGHHREHHREHPEQAATTFRNRVMQVPPVMSEDIESQTSHSPSPHSFNSWVTQLAYSFRSPPITVHHKRISHHHHHHHSGRNSQSARSISSETSPLIKDTRSVSSLLNLTQQPHLPDDEDADEQRKVRIAAAFLSDYEANRSPTWSYRLEDITDLQLKIHEIKYSTTTPYFYPTLLFAAVLSLFLSSALEHVVLQQGDPSWQSSKLLLTALNLSALLVLGVDMCLLRHLRAVTTTCTTTQGGTRASSLSLSSNHHHRRHHHLDTPDAYYSSNVMSENRSSHACGQLLLVKPLILFGVVLAVENVARVLVAAEVAWASAPTNGVVLISSLFKPLALFYVSNQARLALEALRRISSMVLRVLMLEALLILMFAAVACRLFDDREYAAQFGNLATAWLSLFELSTTVVNPSLWMPMYRDNKASALFFVLFVVSCVFYLHSLVLSVVFSTYIYAAGEIQERSAANREAALYSAYRALAMDDDDDIEHEDDDEHDHENDYPSNHHSGGGVGIKISRMRPLLRRLRPHYNAAKISALWEIMAPTTSGPMDYPTFRHKIRQALNASIRTPRNASSTAMTVELLAVVVAVVNFLYVLMVSSKSLDAEPWFDERAQSIIGCVITVVASFELLVRFNPLRIADFSPLTRLNATFDGLALAGVLISAVGSMMLCFDSLSSSAAALECILIGRAIDMIRVMRFFRIFRDVVRRSADVFPALIGPGILVVSTLHIFVYVGMALWGGAVTVGSHSIKITPLYDLNNFNGYQDGLVTMFQVLVVNDWNQVAQVFLYADRCSHPLIVYPFFIIGNLIGVSIMLNILTAFFVESFVTKINDDSDDNINAEGGGVEVLPQGHSQHSASSPIKQSKGSRGDFTIQTPENSRTVLRISTSDTNLPEHGMQQQRQGSFGGRGDADSCDSEGGSSSGESEFYEFDVFEREGLHKIMQTVAGGGPYYNNQNTGSEFARQICDFLEIFESLAPERESIGFLVFDQMTRERFGNHLFQSMTVGFLEVSDLHAIVSGMHAELLALSWRVQDRSLIRTFPQEKMVLEISAALLRRHPALSLFVTRVKKT